MFNSSTHFEQNKLTIKHNNCQMEHNSSAHFFSFYFLYIMCTFLGIHFTLSLVLITTYGRGCSIYVRVRNAVQQSGTPFISEHSANDRKCLMCVQ